MNRSLVLVLVVLAGCGRGSATRSTPPVPVRIAPIVVDYVSVPVMASGTLGPKEDVNLSFKIGGVVERVLVDEGQAVRAGQLLATLDQGEIDPEVARARSAAEKAERDLARARRLYADSVATLEQVQDAETGRDVAHAAYETASFNRRHAVIVAPAAGVILRRHAEPGELVQAGTPIVALGSRARGQVVRVALADRDVVRIHRGDRAVAHFDALPGREITGHISEIAAAADPQTGTYQVDMALGAVRDSAIASTSGLVGTVEIFPPASAAVALVPVEAVLDADGSRGTVFTLDPDGRHAHKHRVTLAFLAGDRIAVTAGLEGARAVIVDGAANLDDGQIVSVEP